MCKLSIIVPVYNSELYLDRLINTVINQTSQNWELIFVDDASQDQSCQIIERYIDLNSKIKLIKKAVNEGPAKARNIGIDNATGDYIGFIDSDDFVSADYVDTMLNAAIKHDADVVWCQLKEVNNASESICTHNRGLGNVRHLNQIEALSLFFTDTKGLGSMWNKIYRRSMVVHHNLRLNEMRTRAEDWEFNIRTFEHIKKLIIIDAILYFYVRSNPNSIMSTFREKDFDLMCTSSIILSKLNKKYQLGFSDGFDTDKNAYSFIEYLINASLQGGRQKKKIISTVLRSDKFKDIMKKCHKDKLSPTFKIIRLVSFTNSSILVNYICNLLCHR